MVNLSRLNIKLSICHLQDYRACTRHFAVMFWLENCRAWWNISAGCSHWAKTKTANIPDSFLCLFDYDILTHVRHCTVAGAQTSIKGIKVGICLIEWAFIKSFKGVLWKRPWHAMYFTVYLYTILCSHNTNTLWFIRARQLVSNWKCSTYKSNFFLKHI